MFCLDFFKYGDIVVIKNNCFFYVLVYMYSFIEFNYMYVGICI